MYMSNSSTHSAENQAMIIQTTNRNFTIVYYYCPNNVNLNIQNMNLKSENFIIVGDFNSHSQSWGYNHIDNRGKEIEDWQDENNITLINLLDEHAHFYMAVTVSIFIGFTLIYSDLTKFMWYTLLDNPSSSS